MTKKHIEQDKDKHSKELEKVYEIYKNVQLLKLEEVPENKQNLLELSNMWKDKDIPLLQRQVVDQQLKNFSNGLFDPVFTPILEALKSLKLKNFSLLDAACATGYYYEVIRSQYSDNAKYTGSDYSEAMIEQARKHYPKVQFDIEDLTKLTYKDKEFDIVLVSGVLEHIPIFEDAISESCRTCNKYVIIHRCPLVNEAINIYTSGSQYNIKTPRIYFSRNLLIKEFNKHQFNFYKEIPLYSNPDTSFINSLKSLVKIYILKKKQNVQTRSIRTLIFKRKN